MKYISLIAILFFCHSANAFTLFTAEDTYTNASSQITDADPHLSRRLVVAWHGLEDPRWNAGSHAAYIKFNTSSLTGVLDSQSIVFARMRLFVSEVVKEGVLIICEINENWSEETLNAHNVPRVGKLITVHSVTKADEKSWIEIETTSLVRKWLLAPEANHGIIITTTDRHDAFIMLGSKESIFESSHIPTKPLPMVEKSYPIFPHPIYTGPSGHPAFIDLVLNTTERD